MSQDIEIAGHHIPASEWESTPASTKALVAHLVGELARMQEQFKQLSEQIAPLAEQVLDLEEQLSKNSQNSSKPPSSEGFGKSKKAKKKKGQRQRGWSTRP